MAIGSFSLEGLSGICEGQSPIIKEPNCLLRLIISKIGEPGRSLFEGGVSFAKLGNCAICTRKRRQYIQFFGRRLHWRNFQRAICRLGTVKDFFRIPVAISYFRAPQEAVGSI